jgi:hypothetical protein
MHTSHQLIELAKQRLALRNGIDLPMTDYRLSKLTGIAQATISNWRVGRSRIDNQFASVFADACELPPEYVLACIEHERTGDPKLRAIYESIADKFKAGALVAAILAAGMGGVCPEKAAFSADHNADPLCIMRLHGHRDGRASKPWSVCSLAP